MYHWILLAKRSSEKSSASKLIAENDDQLRGQINPGIKKQWLWMGLIETLPTVLGFIFSERIQNIVFTYDYLVAGILVSLLLIRIFNKRMPHPPIHLQADKNNNTFNLYTPPIH